MSVLKLKQILRDLKREIDKSTNAGNIGKAARLEHISMQMAALFLSDVKAEDYEQAVKILYE